jgi:hypothetical protein
MNLGQAAAQRATPAGAAFIESDEASWQAKAPPMWDAWMPMKQMQDYVYGEPYPLKPAGQAADEAATALANALGSQRALLEQQWMLRTVLVGAGALAVGGVAGWMLKKSSRK